MIIYKIKKLKKHEKKNQKHKGRIMGVYWTPISTYEKRRIKKFCVKNLHKFYEIMRVKRMNSRGWEESKSI